MSLCNSFKSILEVGLIGIDDAFMALGKFRHFKQDLVSFNLGVDINGIKGSLNLTFRPFNGELMLAKANRDSFQDVQFFSNVAVSHISNSNL